MGKEEIGKLLHDNLLLSFCISPEQGTKLSAKVAIDRGREEAEAREAAKKVR